MSDRERERPISYRIPTGGELRALRTAADLTQAQAARRAGIGTGTLRKWETEQTSPRCADVRELLAIYRIQRETGEAPNAGDRRIATDGGER
jgi:transcriptional regulator with XRE-family HTH domain